MDTLDVDTNSTADILGTMSHICSSFQGNRWRRGYRSASGSKSQRKRVFCALSRGSSYWTHRAMDLAIYRRQRQGRCRNCGSPEHWEAECDKCCGKCSYNLEWQICRSGLTLTDISGNSSDHKVSDCAGNVVCFSCELADGRKCGWG